MPRSALLRALLGTGLAATALVTAGSATGAAPPRFGYASHVGPAFTASAGEPSIATSWVSGATFLQAGLRTAKVTFDAGGRPTWTDVSSSTTRTVSFDPVAAADSQTGRLFVSQLMLVTSLMAYSSDDGRTWSTSQGSGLPAGIDHQSVGGGPYPPESGAGPSGAYPHAVYYCSQDLYTALCARSDDGGLTFGVGVPTYTGLSCAGLHGHVKVGPEGTVYLPNKSCGGGQAVAVSRDAGTTWSVVRVPGALAGANGDPSVAVGRDGTAYVAMSDGSGRATASVSRDKGRSWSRPVDLGASVGVRNASMPSAVAGEGDRAAVAFLGTSTPGDAQDEAFGMDASRTRYTGAEYHLYVATTLDRGRTWTTVDVTPRDPVQRGRICLLGTSCGSSDRNLLDFLDITVDRDGRVLVGWADGCVLTCVTSTAVAANTFTEQGVVTRQTAGPRLFRTPPPVVRYGP